MEHTVGIYILLIGIACLVGIITKWLTQLPYTIALTLVGIALAVLPLGIDIKHTGFSKDLVFYVLLPPLLFQGALHMQLDRLKKHSIAITIFATIGVIGSTFLIGYFTHIFGTFGKAPYLIALLFGALICTTDPVSVLAIFRQCGAPSDLKYLVEGESLFNDGTGVVIFTIILEIVTGTSGKSVEISKSILEFVKVSFGGAIIGIGIGYISFYILRRLTDHLLENAICLVACYGAFWMAESMHLSGVIGVVATGLMIGNYGRRLAMSPKTIMTIETFFESIDFLINSLLFILIGLELKAIGHEKLLENTLAIGLAILAVIIGRLLVVYPLFFATYKTGGNKYPISWSHIIFWGGLRGSIPIALLLGLPNHPSIEPYRTSLLVIGFGVVCFSLIVQGITVKPLISALKIGTDQQDIQNDPGHSQEGLS